jgi:PASTA domain
VPNVVGLTQAAATTAITNAGLVLGTVTTASSSTVPAGSVISESPIAGTQVNAGSAVNLVVSMASPTIAKAFSPTSIASGGSSTVTLTLKNTNTTALTDGAFTDALSKMSAMGGAVGAPAWQKGAPS